MAVPAMPEHGRDARATFPAACHGRHPLPTGEGRKSPSFSLGEKVAEGRGRMMDLFPTVALRPHCGVSHYKASALPEHISWTAR